MNPLHIHDWKKLKETYIPPYDIGKMEGSGRQVADLVEPSFTGVPTIVWECRKCQERRTEGLSGKRSHPAHEPMKEMKTMIERLEVGVLPFMCPECRSHVERLISDLTKPMEHTSPNRDVWMRQSDRERFEFNVEHQKELQERREGRI